MWDAGAGKNLTSHPGIQHPRSCTLLLDSADYAADTSRNDLAARLVHLSLRFAAF
jgi:hypothetical protein